MSDRTFARKKTATSDFSHSSLVSSTTPTLANPTRGFGLPTNNLIQTATHLSTERQEVQSADNGSLEQLTIREKPLSHDISRISFRRPQAKLTVEEPGDSPVPIQKKTLPSADELANRIVRCIGIWETNRGENNPNPKESTLDTVAGVHASMATVEQATMPYAIGAFKKHKKLRDGANPPLTMKEINAAEARCVAVVTLLDLVKKASLKGNDVDTFIKNNASKISDTGLSNDDVKTMFSAIPLEIKISNGKLKNDMDKKTNTFEELLKLVKKASQEGTHVDTFIKNNASKISDTGLSNDDVKTMFSAFSDQIKINKSHDDEKQKISQKLKDHNLSNLEKKKLKEALDQISKRKKLEKTLEQIFEQQKKDYFKKTMDAIIPERDRLGLGLGSLKAYIEKPDKWGENRAGWQRKAVTAMPEDVAKRIESVAVSNNGTALAILVIQDRVNFQLGKKPLPNEDEIVKTVATQNNPLEKNYGENVWKTYHRLYP